MERAATANLMRRLNRSAILNLIRSESPISRTEIARRLRMSLPTVMRATDELASEDLVCFSGSVSTGGRRRQLLRFNGPSYAVLAVDLGGTKMHGMVVDLTGHIQYERSIPVCVDKALTNLCFLFDELIAAPRPQGQTIRGMAVGAPGVTLYESGTVVWAPSLGWRNFPLRDVLSERFDLPTFVENDVNLATLGEYGFGEAKGVSNLVCIALGTGIGSGIMLEGRLYRGQDQASGEVGYLLPDLSCLGQRFDEFGALEGFASGRGIALRAKKVLQSNEEERGCAATITAEEVFAKARQGIAWAQKLIDETVDYLSLMIVNVSAVLNPEMIILSGGVSRSADMLVEPIKARIEGVIPYVPRIVASKLGSRAVAMGAIVVVLDSTTGHVMVDQRV